MANVEDTFYCIGTVAGPHPYPTMVRDFQSVIGNETRRQIIAREGRLPDTLVAAIGGGSNAMGLFFPFLDDPEVAIYGVEAAGRGLDTGLHAASITGGRPGVLHGNKTYLLMDDDGQIAEAHSISAGLDYPGIGPEHAWLHDVGRVNYLSATDDEALTAFRLCCELEGIIPPSSPPMPSPRSWRLHRSACATTSGDEHVWPRRQGHLHRGPAPRSRAVTEMSRIDLLSRAEGGWPLRPRHLRHRRRSRLRNLAGDPRGAARGRRRSDRARHALHRSDGRRAGHPGRRAPGAQIRPDHGEDPGDGPALPARNDSTPLVLMGYYNPIYIYGVERFLADARTAGVDGLIVVDLPPEEDPSSASRPSGPG